MSEVQPDLKAPVSVAAGESGFTHLVFEFIIILMLIFSYHHFPAAPSILLLYFLCQTTNSRVLLLLFDLTSPSITWLVSVCTPAVVPAAVHKKLS